MQLKSVLAAWKPFRNTNNPKTPPACSGISIIVALLNVARFKKRTIVLL